MRGVVTSIAAMLVLATMSVRANEVKPGLKATRDRDGATVMVHAGGLTVTQTLSRTAVALRLVAQGDELVFIAELSGRVSVARSGERRSFSVKTSTADDQAALRRMLAGSPALNAFDVLLQSSWGQSAEAAAIFRSTREVIRVLQGEHQSIEAFAAARPLTSSIVRVRQRPSPSQCWDTYSRDVVHFTYELQGCLYSVASQWWNPLATAWCAYEYNLKSSLAAVWLLDCNGVGV